MYGIQNLIYTNSDFMCCACVWVQSKVGNVSNRDAKALCMHSIRLQMFVCTQMQVGHHAKLLLKLYRRNENENGLSDFVKICFE